MNEPQPLDQSNGCRGISIDRRRNFLCRATKVNKVSMIKRFVHYTHLIIIKIICTDWCAIKIPYSYRAYIFFPMLIGRSNWPLKDHYERVSWHTHHLRILFLFDNRLTFVVDCIVKAYSLII